MKIRHLLLIVFLSFILLGCSSEHTVVLYNDDESIYETYNEVKSNSHIELPVLEEEGQIFVGWTDGEIIYNNDLRIRQDLELSAVFEDVTEVFEYRIDPEDDRVFIEGYNGDAKYLKIPVRIEDIVVRRIDTKAFENSELIEVEIPKTIKNIYYEAFKGSNDLEKISFYGEYFGFEDRTLNSDEYDELIEDYSNTCTVTEDNEDSWSFSEGCPMSSVNGTETFVIEGTEFSVYHVTVDLRYYENDITSLHIHERAFSDLESLTTIEFPSRYRVFHPEIFKNTPRLVNVTFKDNEYFQTIDNIVYINDDSLMAYYPAGLEYENYEIPNFVEELAALAFHDNENLKTIIIPDTLKQLRANSFSGMHSLESIQVDSNNNYFYSIDGVLYGYNHTLIAYPMAKTDTEFVMPETTTTVAPHAFYGQKYLESIIFSSNLEYLGGGAFMEVKKIKVLDVPASVILYDWDLTRDSSIETIIINRSIVEDGSLPNSRMNNHPDFPDIYVPDDSYDEYMSDMRWQFIGNHIYPMSELDTEE